MAQLRTPNHPYDPGFTLPDNVLAEPPGAGTMTTQVLHRKSFYGAPRDWNGGYAVPDYIQAEPAGRGAAYAYDLPRKSIQQNIPGSLGDDSPPEPGFPGDPIKAYGQKAARIVTQAVRSVPAKDRANLLKTIFDGLEPGLDARVRDRAAEYEKKGLSVDVAVQNAIASSVSEGFAKELIRLGKGQDAEHLGYFGLGFSVTDIFTAPVKAIGKVASKTLGAVGSLACTVLGSPLAATAAGGAAVAYGAPPQAGAAGAQLATTMCQKAPKPMLQMPQQPIQPQTPSWVIPAAIGGAGLLLVLLLTRR